MGQEWGGGRDGTGVGRRQRWDRSGEEAEVGQEWGGGRGGTGVGRRQDRVGKRWDRGGEEVEVGQGWEEAGHGRSRKEEHGWREAGMGRRQERRGVEEGVGGEKKENFDMSKMRYTDDILIWRHKRGNSCTFAVKCSVGHTHISSCTKLPAYSQFHTPHHVIDQQRAIHGIKHKEPTRVVIGRDGNVDHQQTSSVQPATISGIN